MYNMIMISEEIKLYFLTKKQLFALFFFFFISATSCYAEKLAPGLYHFDQAQGNYSLFVPSRNSQVMVVALHGSGERAPGYIANWVSDAARSGYVILVPNAIDKNGWQGKDIPPIIKNTLACQKDYDINKTIISGASSGGHFALLLGINYYQYFDGIAVFMGIISQNLGRWIEFQEEPWNRRPIFMVHGDKDTMVPIQYGRMTAKMLQGKGYPTTFVEEKDMAHEHYRKANIKIINWIQAIKKK
ncbi:MAG TPA: hypothetical protein DF296_09940 [Candidatus Margulisbacteria bacterium]|nr:hypothetical protein [Candidatus Margulisiibacteriota bacterium]HCT85507.1 hypothetical protein [Candidatus Margulisiibacteriota bacterium]